MVIMYIQMITLVLLKNLTSRKLMIINAVRDIANHVNCLIKNELAASPKLFIVTNPRTTIRATAIRAGRSMCEKIPLRTLIIISLIQ